MNTFPYEQILAALPYGLCVVDAEGRILDANPALEQLLGWHAGQRRGQSLAEYLEQRISDPAQALCWSVALSQALALGQTTYMNLPTDLGVGAYGASFVSVIGVISPWQGSDARRSGAKGSGALVLLQDSSFQKDVEGMQARFLAVLGHELSTPVTNLTAATEQLARHLGAGPEEPRRLLQVIQGEATHLRRLLAQFPTKLPAETETLDPRRRLITLRPILRQVAQAFQVRDLECEIVVDAPADLAFVWSDAERIQDILSKLVDNAIRYAPPGTQVVLSAEERSDEIVVCVRDRGPGVLEEDGEAIFSPWRRGSREEEGANHQGLGLSIARTLVQSLGGKLWYEKRSGGGISFCFSLMRAGELPDQTGEGD